MLRPRILILHYVFYEYFSVSIEKYSCPAISPLASTSFDYYNEEKAYFTAEKILLCQETRRNV